MKRLLISASGLVFATSLAQAGSFDPAPAEPAVAAPVIVAPAPSTDWTGAYAGLQLGYGTGDADGTDFDGVIGGGHVGYRQDFGTWVLGGELDYNIADLGFDGGGGEVDEVARLKLQAGYDMGNSLLYATAGAARAGADVGGTSLSDNGWVAGLGFDTRITSNMTAGVEYLYHDFGSDFDGSGAEVTASTIQARVGFQF